VKLELTAEEADVVRRALDMYARMGMGQLEVAVDEFLQDNFHDRYYDKGYPLEKGPCTRGPLVTAHVDDIKALVFEQPHAGSWSIGNEKVPVKSQTAWALRKRLLGEVDNG
jgi:hypothetical protein